MVEFLKEEWARLDQIMTEVFRKFDKDGSNFIDASELKQVSMELSGKELTDAELDEVMSDFNVTKENKISEEQFKQWWASGKQGLSPMMKQLLGAKLKTVEFLNSVSSQLKESLTQT